jgi:hypothetical protein
MTRGEVAAALGQDADHELMGLFATHLRQLGERVRDEEGGSFLALARSGAGSAVALAERLASWPTARRLPLTTASASPSSSARRSPPPTSPWPGSAPASMRATSSGSASSTPSTATAVDNVLWHRGAAPRSNAHPRHRARTTAY